MKSENVKKQFVFVQMSSVTWMKSTRTLIAKAIGREKTSSFLNTRGNNQDNFECIWGVRHLHFQIGQKYRDRANKGNYWGHSYFLEDGKRAMNPHLYWANGPNVVTCYEPNKQYKNGTITYPVPCR